MNNASVSVYFNPWSLSLNLILPEIQFQRLTSVSQLFSPSFTRALFVRHPLDRLVSAYKERIAILQKDRIQPEPHYDGIRKAICRQFLSLNLAEQGRQGRHICEDSIPPFEHFVRYILLNTRTSIEIARMDGHWKPFTVSLSSLSNQI